MSNKKGRTPKGKIYKWFSVSLHIASNEDEVKSQILEIRVRELTRNDAIDLAIHYFHQHYYSDAEEAYVFADKIVSVWHVSAILFHKQIARFLELQYFKEKKLADERSSHRTENNIIHFRPSEKPPKKGPTQEPTPDGDGDEPE